jgi:ATP-binding cassette, subfamily F, member 2
LQDIYDRIDRMDPATFEVRATEILMGLGFSTVGTPLYCHILVALVDSGNRLQAFLKKRTRDLSGGWRMRVALARALLMQVS